MTAWGSARPPDGWTLPFVAVDVEGGVYEVGSFMAGFLTSMIVEKIRVLAPGAAEGFTVPAALVEQLDLFAMMYGLSFHSYIAPGAEQGRVSFRKPVAAP